ncbi:hypothetical protein E2C01_069865 [Portunus trituberculatus]|uniref:Uncharacterized protein n=1 Tax=Portunus trituberculatus TaxID=210409 RepID=A0A5B7I206_PORTR|nr:hypothetical protein [Portunus trituberculatus]
MNMETRHDTEGVRSVAVRKTKLSDCLVRCGCVARQAEAVSVCHEVERGDTQHTMHTDARRLIHTALFSSMLPPEPGR